MPALLRTCSPPSLSDGDGFFPSSCATALLAAQAFGAETLYGAYFGPGDAIGVLLDAERGTLAFVKDGDDFNVGRAVVANLGTAYRQVR